MLAPAVSLPQAGRRQGEHSALGAAYARSPRENIAAQACRICCANRQAAKAYCVSASRRRDAKAEAKTKKIFFFMQPTE